MRRDCQYSVCFLYSQCTAEQAGNDPTVRAGTTHGDRSLLLGGFHLHHCRWYVITVHGMGNTHSFLFCVTCLFCCQCTRRTTSRQAATCSLVIPGHWVSLHYSCTSASVLAFSSPRGTCRWLRTWPAPTLPLLCREQRTLLLSKRMCRWETFPVHERVGVWVELETGAGYLKARQMKIGAGSTMKYSVVFLGEIQLDGYSRKPGAPGLTWRCILL